MAAILALWPLWLSLSVQVHRSLTHRAIHRKAEFLNTERLSLSVADFPLLEKQKEFDYKGNRYDVVKLEKQGDTWEVIAVNDTREKQLEKVIEGQREGSGKTSGPVWLKTDWMPGVAYGFHPVAFELVLKIEKPAPLPDMNLSPACLPPEWFCLNS